MNVAYRWRQSLLLFMAARDARERRMLAAGGLVIGLALIYILLINPALSGRAQLHKSLPGMHQQVAELQVLARQAQALSGKAAVPVATASKESIDTSLARSGLSAQSVVLSGDFIKVQLAGAPFAGIAGWLDELQTSARVAVTQASITSLPEVGMVNATLTLRQQKNEQSE